MLLILVNYLRDQIQLLHSTHHQLFSDRIEWEKVGNGTPQGGGEVVSIFGEFNNLKESDWNVLIEIKEGKVDLESMGISNGIRLGGELFD